MLSSARGWIASRPASIAPFLPTGARSTPGRHARSSTALAVVALVVTVPIVEAAEVCFSTAGTYGALTVTQSGPGCGTFLTYGGLTNGLYMGNSNTTEACTFSFSPAVQGSTIKTKMTAHSCVAGGCEEARFSVNGTHHVVTPAELDNTQPPGGSPLTITAAGDILGSPVGNGDGRATVTFLSAAASVTSFTINHFVVSGSPAGTIYEVCADDTAAGPPPPATPTAPIPTLSQWALLLLAALLAGAGLVMHRRGRSG